MPDDYLMSEEEAAAWIDRWLSEMFPHLYRKPEPTHDSLERIEADFPQFFSDPKLKGEDRTAGAAASRGPLSGPYFAASSR